MLFFHLFLNHWKSIIRNEHLRRNLFGKIIFGILIIYFLLIGVFLWFNIDTLLTKFGNNPITIFNSLIIWYIVFDNFLRCLIQPLPILNVYPYLRLRIRRSEIINYLLTISLWNIFNLIPLLFVLPFIIKIVIPNYGINSAIYYTICFLLLTIINNFLAVFIGYLLKKNLIYMILSFSIVGVFIIFNKSFQSINSYSIIFGQFLLQGSPILFFLLISTLFIILFLTHRLLNNRFYIDQIDSRKKQNIKLRIFDYSSFAKFGDIGKYIFIELCLLTRNKKPKQMFGLMPLFIVYCLFFTFNKNNNELGKLFLNSMLIGFVALIYGQFIFTWESSYFDGLMSRKNNFIAYLKAKYYLMIGLSLIYCFPFFLTLVVTRKFDVILLMAILLFILGVNCFLIMVFGTYNDGRMDLSESHFTGHQSLKSNQFIAGLIFNFLPVGLYILLKYLFNDITGKLFLFILGIFFILSHHWWVQYIIAPHFRVQKHKNLEGYRKLTI